MSKSQSIEKSKDVQGGWGRVRSDTEDALGIAKARVRALKRSLHVLNEKIKKGEPFPEYLSNEATRN